MLDASSCDDQGNAEVCAGGAPLSTSPGLEAMGDEIIFICKEATAMHKLMNAFCQRQGVPRSSTRFWYNQQRIEDYHTPGALGINDGDLVDVSVSGARDPRASGTGTCST